MSELTFLSDNDNEILKALKLADEIGRISDSSTMQTSNEVKKLSFESESIISDNNSVFTSVTELSADSGYPMNSSNNLFSTYNSLKFVPEFRNVCHDAQSLDLMFNLFNERCKFFKEKNLAFMKDAKASSQEILSENFLNEKIEQFNNMIRHIVTVTDQMHKIQQVLQEKPWEDTINVNPSCQKAVVKFFSTANEIMKIIGQQAELIENYTRNNTTLVSKSYDAELQSKLQNIILGLARRIDTISRFREHMSLQSV